MTGDEILTMRHITKNFPGVLALNDVDFTLRKGEIHALMGENGAGKSTLVKVLTGAESLEEGEIRVSWIDHPIVNHSPEEAQENGISTVYQEVNLCPNLSVAENIYIGREPTKFGHIDWKQIRTRSQKVLDGMGINVDVTRNLEEYSVAIQQMIAIARAIDLNAKILILDEPTSSLDDSEVKKLFSLMNQLKEKGVGIIFITHFLEQVYEVSDRITVLRNGALVGEYATESLPRIKLVSAMLGHDLDDLASIKKGGFGNAATEQKSGDLVQAIGLGAKGKIKPFDLSVHKGDVIGLAGLLGSGRSEMARALYGADPTDCGSVKIQGKDVKISAPIDAMKSGMGFLPEDRKADGIIGNLSVRENIIIALQAKRGITHTMSMKEMSDFAEKYIKLLQIKTASMETPVKSLSGGNQQKVILGRWLLTQPEFLILDEPTRGIDVGTKTEIQKLVVQLADQGTAVIFISSEIEEMLRTANRICVLRDGKKVGEISGSELNETEVMAAIAGEAENE